MRDCKKCGGSFAESEFCYRICKNCKRAYARGRYYKNLEAFKSRSIAWAKANPERARQINRLADLKRKAKPARLEQRRVNRRKLYLRSDKEKILASGRKYDRSHKKERYEANKRRRLKNPEPSRRHAMDRLVRLKGITIRDFTPEQWRQRLEEFDYHCAYCWASGVLLTKDHLIPISRGGHHTMDNIVPACKPCNSRKRNRSMLEILRLVS